jgi:hypothetical protein
VHPYLLIVYFFFLKRKIKLIEGSQRLKTEKANWSKLEQVEHFLPKNEKVPIGEIEIETLCQNGAESAPFAPNCSKG